MVLSQTWHPRVPSKAPPGQAGSAARPRKPVASCVPSGGAAVAKRTSRWHDLARRPSPGETRRHPGCTMSTSPDGPVHRPSAPLPASTCGVAGTSGRSGVARLIVAGLVLTLLAAPLSASPVEAQGSCQFVLGFATLRDLASPRLVGSCLEDEHHSPTGDALQQTTGGLLVWRKADNWTAFTDGARTWLNGPGGLAQRFNEQRFEWEADAAAFPRPPTTGPSCGAERWAVKTLSDSAAGTVELSPQRTAVDGLRALPAPRLGAATPRLPGVERTTFAVQADLVRMALEDDEDIHLVVADPADAGHTMIVEFPDPDCQGVVEGTQQAQIAAARAAFIDACGAPPRGRFSTLSGSATITGVGFFDVLHGQNGVAPNGVELHPVLRVDQVTCQATP
jgi:hypothetical protein